MDKIDEFMKKYITLFISFFIFVFCFSQPAQKIRISYVKIYPDYSVQIEKGKKVYFIYVELKNESNGPIFFWSWVNGWFRNVIFSRKDVCPYRNFISDAPLCSLLLPHLNIKYRGRFYVQNDVDQCSIENLSIAFKFYDALKYTEDEYLAKDYQLIDERKMRENRIRIIADTIRYNKEKMYLFLPSL
jgi:hypothetical protein